MDTLSHVSEDRLELYALGRLEESEVDSIEQHLFVCEHCRNVLEETGEAALAFREELRRPVPVKAGVADWFSWLTPRMTMAGAFAALVLAIGIYWIGADRRLAPMASLQLTAMRGEMQTVQAARETRLTLSDAPATGGPFRVEVVDGGGAKMWNGIPVSSAQGLQANVATKLSAGDYFVRLYGPKDELLHEYGFHVKN